MGYKKNPRGCSVETKTLDKLLSSLREYYKEVKTRRQLGLDVPAGFWVSSSIEKDYKFFTLPRKGLPIDESFPASSDDISSTTSTIPTTPISHQSTDSSRIPIIRCVDKPSTSLPNTISFSEDFLCASVGFRRIDTIHQHFSTLYKNTIHFDPTPADAVLDENHFATMKK